MLREAGTYLRCKARGRYERVCVRDTCTDCFVPRMYLNAGISNSEPDLSCQRRLGGTSSPPTAVSKSICGGHEVASERAWSRPGLESPKNIFHRDIVNGVQMGIFLMEIVADVGEE